ncbi:MAG: PDZ domain-containing protein [Pyrinomonadaceae bacterium]
MIGKVLSFAMFTAVATNAVTAQTPPSPAPRPEARAFSFQFDGEGGYLGVQTEEVTRENIGKLGLREVRGVAVAKVIEGSPAQSAGLQDGDVIVRIDGEDISSGRKLTRLVSEISPDHTAKVTVLRGGSEREINVTLGKRPMPKFAEGAFASPEGFKNFEFKFPAKDFEFNMPDLDKLEKYKFEPGKPGEPFVFAFGNQRQIGVSLTPLTKQLSDHFGVTNGALVNNVREDSPAAKAGLKAGDIITEVDGKAVKGELDVVRAIGEKKEGEVTLTYSRGGQKNTVRLTPEKGEGNFFKHFEWDGEDHPAPVPGQPGQPGVFKMQRPGTPAAPMPMNQLFIPGRVV